MVFQGFPGTPQVERTTPVEGNGAVQLGSKLANLEHSCCQIQAIRLYVLKSEALKGLEGRKLVKLQDWYRLQGCKLTICQTGVIG